MAEFMMERLCAMRIRVDRTKTGNDGKLKGIIAVDKDWMMKKLFLVLVVLVFPFAPLYGVTPEAIPPEDYVARNNELAEQRVKRRIEDLISSIQANRFNLCEKVDSLAEFMMEHKRVVRFMIDRLETGNDVCSKSFVKYLSKYANTNGKSISTVKASPRVTEALILAMYSHEESDIRKEIILGFARHLSCQNFWNRFEPHKVPQAVKGTLPGGYRSWYKEIDYTDCFHFFVGRDSIRLAEAVDALEKDAAPEVQAALTLLRRALAGHEIVNLIQGAFVSSNLTPSKFSDSTVPSYRGYLHHNEFLPHHYSRSH